MTCCGKRLVPQEGRKKTVDRHPLLLLLRHRLLDLDWTISLPLNRNRNYNEGGVGINIRDSLGVMGLEAGVTAREVKVRYRFLARQLHPDKHDTEETGMTSEEAVELFKLVNNAQEHLREIIRS